MNDYRGVGTYGHFTDAPGMEHPGEGDGGDAWGRRPAVQPLTDVLDIAHRALDRGADERDVWNWLARRYIDSTEARP